jgi:hypothetical protein
MRFGGPDHKIPRHLFPLGMPGAESQWMTRRAYETTLRRAVVETCPNVRFVAGTVTAFNAKWDGNGNAEMRSVGVRPSNGEVVEILATLVIGTL